MLITHQLLSHISCRHHCDSTSVLGKDGKGTVLWSLLPAISGIQCCCLTWLPLIPWGIASEVLLGSSPSCFCSPLRLHGKPGEIGWMNGKLQRGQTECGVFWLSQPIRSAAEAEQSNHSPKMGRKNMHDHIIQGGLAPRIDNSC